MAARITVTTNWQELTQEQKQKLQAVFARYIITGVRKEKTA